MGEQNQVGICEFSNCETWYEANRYVRGEHQVFNIINRIIHTRGAKRLTVRDEERRAQRLDLYLRSQHRQPRMLTTRRGLVNNIQYNKIQVSRTTIRVYYYFYVNHEKTRPPLYLAS